MKITLLTPAFAISTISLFAAKVAFAQPAGSLQNPIRFGSLIEVLSAILDILVIFAVPIIVFFLIYAGFMYVTAQGNAAKITAATNALLYALIGGVIILGAEIIGGVIANTVDSIR
jgi:mannose/fructose/N-acetylgalactosamine-specific phosphotransferase system component IID